MAFIWLGLRKEVSSSFFQAVQHSFKLLRKQTGILLGMTMVFQSHGKSLSYKPHMHAMVTSGGMINKKWVTIDSLPYNQLRKAFQEEFQKQLLKKTSGAIHYDLTKIFSQSDDREWKLFPTFHRNTGNAIVNYLSHSICGVVIDMNQDFIIDYENKIIHFKEYRGTEEVWTSLTRDVFTDRYLNHIPQKHEVTIRNYGLYSNKYRKELEGVRKENSMTLNTKENEIPDPESVELCPVCGTPLKVAHYFQPGTIPDILLPFIQDTSRDPPAHGELIKAS